MKKINLLITKRGRDDYLKLVLHNFNLADSIEDYDVIIYIGEDDKDNINKIDYSVYKNLTVKHLYIPNLPQAGRVFCRGHILNLLLQEMRQDYDWVSIADTDMVYRKSFFNDLAKILGTGSHRPPKNSKGSLSRQERVVIAKGVYSQTEQDSPKILAKNSDYDYIMNNYSYTDFATSSQISMTKEYHEKIKQVLAVSSIFDTSGLGYDFIGYGAEDTLVKRILQSSKAELVVLNNAWVHVWHERQEVVSENKKHNKKIMKLLQKESIIRLKAHNYYTNRQWRKLTDSIKNFLHI